MRLNIPVKRIVAATLASSGAVKKYHCETRLAEASQTETPYGKVVDEIVVPLTDGGETTLYFNNPFALLYAAASKKKAFGSFLHQHLARDGDELASHHLLLGRDNTWQ